MLALRKILVESETAMKTNEILNVADVAAELNVPRAAVRAWIAAGRLRAFRVGRVIRIQRRWLDAFVAQATWPPLESGEAMPIGVGLRGS